MSRIPSAQTPSQKQRREAASPVAYQVAWSLRAFAPLVRDILAPQQGRTSSLPCNPLRGSRKMKPRLSLVFTLILFATALTLTSAASAQVSEQVIYSFPSPGPQGYWPATQLVYRSGKFFGTTNNGGEEVCNCGVVFELAPKTGGGWNYKVLHVFQGSPDGASPVGNIVFDSAGNLYGAAPFGGNYSSRGTVFELSPNANGSWTYNTLHSFGNTGDGSYPAGLAIDAAGNLYGPAGSGGANNAGAIFKLAPGTDGAWTESLIYSFSGPTDGAGPNANLAIDTFGDLYGTTYNSGPNNLGTVFELTPGIDGDWTESTLFSPYSSLGIAITLTLDASGNVYCTTYPASGSENLGAVFELTSNSDGSWLDTTLHTFIKSKGGQYPKGALAVSTNGILYGTTQFGGANNFGIIYTLKPGSNGTWVFNDLYSFAGGTTDGQGPLEGVTLVSGSLYGTTINGGEYSNGAIFKLTP